MGNAQHPAPIATGTTQATRTTHPKGHEMARRELPQEWRTLMDQKGLSSVRRLAEKTGLQHTTILQLIHGSVHQPKRVTMEKVAEALDVPLSTIERMSGYTADTTEPWQPPTHSGHLTLEERAALDQLIRIMTADRLPKGRQAPQRPSNVHRLHPERDRLDVAADNHQGPDEGALFEDWVAELDEEDDR